MGGAIPTDLTWTKETDMSLLPSADGWTYSGTATEANAFSVSGGKLYQNAAGLGSATTGGYQRTTTLNNSTGWSVSTKLQVHDDLNSTVSPSCEIDIQDGSKRLRVFFHEYFIELYGAASLDFIQVDLKSKVSDVVILGKGSDFYILVNGKLIYDGTGLLTSTTAVNQIAFGDNAGTAGHIADATWHYVNYIESYEAPTFTTTPLYDFGSWQKDASSILADLAASTVKSISGLKEDWVKEAERAYTSKGIGDATTTVTTYPPIDPVPQTQLFFLGEKCDFKYQIVYSSNTASRPIYLRLSVDGDSKETSEVIDTTASSVSLGTTSSSHEFRELDSGLHFLNVLARTISGTTTFTGNRRMVTVGSR